MAAQHPVLWATPLVIASTEEIGTVHRVMHPGRRSSLAPAEDAPRAPFAVNARTGLPLALTGRVTRSAAQRLRGLLARPPLRPGEALLIRPCNGVHTCGMGYPIDVVFLDRDGRVVRVVVALRPWRFVPWVRGARAAIELPAGAAAACGLLRGDRVDVTVGAA